MPVGEDRFQVSVSVAVSNQFLGWIMALGSGVKIVAPAKVVDLMKTEIARLAEQYEV